jgi:hypothetical protein
MPKSTKTAAAKTKSRKVNKSAWIRSQPESLSAKDVLNKAKGEGIQLSIAQVYTARSTAKKQPAQAATSPAKRGPGRPKGAPAKAAVSGDLRRQFMVLAVRLGSDEAKRLLDRIVDVQAGN